MTELEKQAGPGDESFWVGDMDHPVVASVIVALCRRNFPEVPITQGMIASFSREQLEQERLNGGEILIVRNMLMKRGLDLAVEVEPIPIPQPEQFAISEQKKPPR